MADSGLTFNISGNASDFIKEIDKIQAKLEDTDKMIKGLGTVKLAQEGEEGGFTTSLSKAKEATKDLIGTIGLLKDASQANKVIWDSLNLLFADGQKSAMGLLESQNKLKESTKDHAIEWASAVRLMERAKELGINTNALSSIAELKQSVQLEETKVEAIKQATRATEEFSKAAKMPERSIAEIQRKIDALASHEGKPNLFRGEIEQARHLDDLVEKLQEKLNNNKSKVGEIANANAMPTDNLDQILAKVEALSNARSKMDGTIKEEEISSRQLGLEIDKLSLKYDKLYNAQKQQSKMDATKHEFNKALAMPSESVNEIVQKQTRLTEIQKGLNKEVREESELFNRIGESVDKLSVKLTTVNDKILDKQMMITDAYEKATKMPENSIKQMEAKIKALEKFEGKPNLFRDSSAQAKDIETRVQSLASRINRLKNSMNEFQGAMQMPAGTTKEIVEKYNTLYEYRKRLNRSVEEEEKAHQRIGIELDKLGRKYDKVFEKNKAMSDTQDKAHQYKLIGNSPEDSIKDIDEKSKKLKDLSRQLNTSYSEQYTLALRITEVLDKLAQKRLKLSQGGGDLGESMSLPEQSIGEIEKKIKALDNAIKTLSPLDIEGIDATKAKIKELQDVLHNAEKGDPLNRAKDALNMPERTINERVEKIKALKKAQADLNTTTKEGVAVNNRINSSVNGLSRANDKATGTVRRLNTEMGKLNETAENIGRRLTVLFSVYALQNFAQKLVEIGGEFELQRKSLAAIIKDPLFADKLFSQQVRAGLESPFQIMDLISYTKQLAAYRIENERLFDVTKRLADISSGLGVDMNRLVLAYGQIKSASVLRGQEIRQLSEAGIPIIDALADKLTKLEGRLVSTGEVFERVSSRGISFKMVDEIFQDMTDSSGAFYNMQKEQATTLKGQWSNMIDAMQVMYDQMAKQNRGVLVGSINMMRTIMANWESWVTFFQIAIPTLFATFLGVQIVQLVKFNKELQTLILLSKTLSFIKFAGVALPIAAASYLITKLTEAHFALVRYRKEFAGLINVELTQFNNKSARLKVLAEQLSKANVGTQEHRKLINEVNNGYSEWLDKTLTEADALDTILNKQDGIIDRMRQASAIRASDAAKAKAEEFWGGRMDKSESTLKDLFKSKGIDEGAVEIVFNRFNEQISNLAKNGEKLKPTKDLVDDLFGQLSKFTNVDLSMPAPNLGAGAQSMRVQQMGIKNLITEMNGYVESVVKLNEYIKKADENVQNMFMPNYPTKDYYQIHSNIVEGADNAIKEIRANFKGSDFEINGKIDSIKLQRDLDLVKLKVKAQIIGVTQGNLEIENLKNWDKGVPRDYNNKLKAAIPLFDQRATLEMTKENIENGYLEFADKLVDRYNTIKNYNEKVSKMGKKLNIDRKELAKGLQDEKNLLKALSLMGIDPNESKGGGSKKDVEAEKMRERIKLYKDARSTYNEYLKSMSEADAKKAVNDIYTKMFNNQDAGKFEVDFILSDQSYDKAIADFEKNAKSKDAKKIAMEAKVDLDKESVERNVKKLGESLENELKKLNEQYDFSVKLREDNVSDDYLSIFGLPAPMELAQYMQGLLDIRNKFISKGGEEDLKKAEEINAKIQEINVNRITNLMSLKEKYGELSERIAIAEGKKEVNTKELELLQKMADPTSEQIFRTEELIYQNKELDSTIADLSKSAYESSNIFKELYGDIDLYTREQLKSLITRINESLSTYNGEVGMKQLADNKYEVYFRNLDGTISRATMTQEAYNRALKQLNKLRKDLRNEDPIIAIKDALAAKNMGLSISLISAEIQKISELTSEVGGIAEMLGANDDTIEVINGIGEAIGGLGEVGDGVGRIMQGDILGGVTGVVKGIGKVISSIFTMTDAKWNKRIKEQVDLIEQLKVSYDDLQRAIRDVVGSKEADANIKSRIENLNKQAEASRKAAEYERKKKKTDKDKVKEYNNQALEAEKQAIDELRTYIEDLSITVADAASAFADSWVEAFLTGEDMIESFNKSWDDMMKNILKNAISKGYIEAMIKPMISAVQNAVDPYGKGGSMITPEEAAQIMAQRELFKENLLKQNESMMDLLESLGLTAEKYKDTNDSLQKGIQNITESTATIIASYLNSMLYQVVAQTPLIREMAVHLESMNVLMLEYSPKFLDQLRAINGNTKDIADILRSVRSNDGQKLRIQ